MYNHTLCIGAFVPSTTKLFTSALDTPGQVAGIDYSLPRTYDYGVMRMVNYP